MGFEHFSGVFGVYDRTELLAEGQAGLADRNFAVPNHPALSYQTASWLRKGRPAWTKA